MLYSKSIAHLIAELERLPGIGPKSAQRLAYFLLRQPKEETDRFAQAILEARKRVRFCDTCFSITDEPICEICRDPRRDPQLLCVVAEARDVAAMERTNEFRGLYHVLNGLISPMEGIGPERLKVRELVKRVGETDVREIIMATNPTVEGDATAMYLAKLLRPLCPRITRIAHGMPIGGDLDYADQATLISALEYRREL